MTRKNPNWLAAACGLAYAVCFLFLPIYKISGIGSWSGAKLLGDSPILIFLLVCGLAMIGSSLLLEERISIGVGGVSAVLTLIFGFLGLHMVPEGSFISKAGKLVGEMFNTEMNLGYYVSASMSWGLILCLILSILHIVLEVLLYNPRARKIEPQIWEDSNNGSIDF